MLGAIDWLIIGLYFVLSAAVGFYYTRRAGSSVREFFLSGRNLPWWLAGTSMVATTFAADTPLAVTELVAKHGIAGNWLWWNFVCGGVLTVFFFARLWRRAGILTDVEFVELRYAGRPAAFLRGFRALYLGLFINTVILGWVNLAMASVLEGMFGIPRDAVMLYVALAMGLTALYAALSGLWGVAVTDAFQFVLAMAGTVVLAVVVLDLPQIGGLAGLVHKLPSWTLELTPAISGGPAGDGSGPLTLSAAAFFAFIGIQWWACWYPGSEPGGGGYVAQRMMSARDERHAQAATLWFTIAHYCVRPWPWILVGLATLVLYPDLGPADKRLGYVYAMRDHLPAGIKGMLVAAFFAAYMSTVATQLNWGTSYIVNDVYRRFVRPDAPERHLVAVARGATLAMMALSLCATFVMDTISGAWAFLLEAGAGLGLVLILRWYWWRINAWSEIAAMAAPLAVCAWLRFATQVRFPETLYIIVAATTAAWVLVTYLTRPTDAVTLGRFYRRVHPGGPGWAAVARSMPEVQGDRGCGKLLRDWLCGVILVYAVLFGAGKLLLLQAPEGLAFLAAAAAAAWVIARDTGTRATGHRAGGTEDA